MKLKVTALKKVTLRALVPSQSRRNVGRSIVTVPSEKEDWLDLAEGDVALTGLVLGVHPRCLPDEAVTHIDGVPRVEVQCSVKTLPQEFYGLFRLEVSGSNPR